MSQKDRQKWDAKYHGATLNIENGAPSHLLALYHNRAPGLKALDIACGTGRNALFLAHQGFDVDALDISQTGLDQLEKQASNVEGKGEISCGNIDLDDYDPPEQTYDLIIVANFLNRALIPKLGLALNIGGLIVIDTFMAFEGRGKSDFNPDFLLKHGELATYFETGFDILKYRMFCDNCASNDQDSERWKQAIVAKRL